MPDAIAEEFAAELRAARARRNLTKAQLAALVGVAPVTIYRLERAEREVTLGCLIRIANALGMPARDFVDGPADAHASQSAGGAK